MDLSNLSNIQVIVIIALSGLFLSFIIYNMNIKNFTDKNINTVIIIYLISILVLFSKTIYNRIYSFISNHEVVTENLILVTIFWYLLFSVNAAGFRAKNKNIYIFIFKTSTIITFLALLIKIVNDLTNNTSPIVKKIIIFNYLF